MPISFRNALLPGALLSLAVTTSAAAAPYGTDVSAKLVTCHNSSTQAERYADFSARIKRTGVSVPVSTAIRFELLSRTTGGFSSVEASGLGQWESVSSSTVYKVKKRVTNLDEPAQYRAKVSFRWTDEAGESKIVTKLTKICKLRDTSPDLVAPSDFEIKRLGATGSELPYLFTVRNAGTSAASNFDVILTVDGIAQPAVTVERVAAKGKRKVRVSAPICTAGSSVQIEVDPDGRISESDETNNTAALDCDTGTTTPAGPLSSAIN